VPGVVSVQAVLLNPEIPIVVVREDNFPTRREGKPTLSTQRKAGVQSYAKASTEGHHRGLGTGHVRRGVPRELGRAHSFPAIFCRRKGYRLITRSWH
jgi:hypothetical protein